jgi:hypothetical protein
MLKLWALLQKRKQPATVSQPPAVTSGPGGVAAGRDVRDSQINIGQLPPPSPEAARR